MSILPAKHFSLQATKKHPWSPRPKERGDMRRITQKGRTVVILEIRRTGNMIHREIKAETKSQGRYYYPFINKEFVSFNSLVKSSCVYSCGCFAAGNKGCSFAPSFSSTHHICSGLPTEVMKARTMPCFWIISSVRVCTQWHRGFSYQRIHTHSHTVKHSRRKTKVSTIQLQCFHKLLSVKFPHIKIYICDLLVV